MVSLQNSEISSVISRIVDENVRRYLLHMVVIWVIFVMGALSVEGVLMYNKYRSVVSVHQQEQQKLAYWEEIIRRQPNYPAAYYQAALSAVRLHDPQKALSYLHQALLLDPNFSQAEVFAKEIAK